MCAPALCFDGLRALDDFACFNTIPTFPLSLVSARDCFILLLSLFSVRVVCAVRLDARPAPEWNNDMGEVERGQRHQSRELQPRNVRIILIIIFILARGCPRFLFHYAVTMLHSNIITCASLSASLGFASFPNFNSSHPSFCPVNLGLRRSPSSRSARRRDCGSALVAQGGGTSASALLAPCSAAPLNFNLHRSAQTPRRAPCSAAPPQWTLQVRRPLSPLLLCAQRSIRLLAPRPLRSRAGASPCNCLWA